MISVHSAGQRLVDRVVDDLEDQVMQTADGGVADIHAWTPADAFQAFEDLNVPSFVLIGPRSDLAVTGSQMRFAGSQVRLFLNLIHNYLRVVRYQAHLTCCRALIVREICHALMELRMSRGCESVHPS